MGTRTFRYKACPEAIRANPFITTLAQWFGTVTHNCERVDIGHGEQRIFNYTTAEWRGKTYWVDWFEI